MKQPHPSCVVLTKQSRILVAFCDEVKCLAETKQEDDVDDAECCHVTQDHAVDHCHEGSGQRNGSEIEFETLYFLDSSQ